MHISIPGRLLGEGQGMICLDLHVQEDGSVHVGHRSSDILGDVGFNPISRHRSYRVEVDDKSGGSFCPRRLDKRNS